MGRLLRHLVAIAALPFLVAVLVPLWLAHRHPEAAILRFDGLAGPAGLAVLAAGLFLFGSCLGRFAGEGRGTLAPWDPPRRLVLSGPYRYVRNPMITGVWLVLLGEALVLRSIPQLTWAAVFLLLNAIYIPAVEEPGLARRFGPGWLDYRTNVPRFLPRLRPWRGQDPD